jgi:hypothetical protein
VAKAIRHPLLWLFAFYSLAYGLLLANPGVYWDDWTLADTTKGGIKAQFSGNGQPYFALIHIFLQSITGHPGYLYHSLTFVLFFISIVIIYYSLPYFGIAGIDSYAISLLLAVMPCYFARTFMICFPYSLSFCLCFLGLFLYIKHSITRKWPVRLLALVAQLLAYMLLNSMLVFLPSLLAIFAIVREKRNINEACSAKKSLSIMIRSLIGQIDAFSVPVIF